MLQCCKEADAKPQDNPDNDRLFKVKMLIEHLKQAFDSHHKHNQQVVVNECIWFIFAEDGVPTVPQRQAHKMGSKSVAALWCYQRV